MDSEKELVFAKYLAGRGLASPQAIKACLRAQASRGADGEPRSLAEVIAEEGVLDAKVLAGHQLHFEANLRRCDRCTAYFYAAPEEEARATCPRCSAAARGEEARTGFTGAFRRAQLGDMSSRTREPAQAAPRAQDPPPRAPAATPTSAPMPDALERFGEYEIVDVVARGGMGVVYKARHASLGRVVALKVLREGQRHSESHVRRFRREAQSIAKLLHPNIVRIHEFGFENEQHFFTMDFIEGTSFERFVEDASRDLRVGVGYVRDVARALACAHRNGVIHRDVKPANILIDQAGLAKITDFGLASNVDHKSALTQEGELLGTPLYMSPEQVRGRVKEIDERSDVYSLGAVLYQHLTGQLPFLAQTMVDLQYKVLNEEPAPPRAIVPDLDPQIETIALKCLEKSRDARYQSAEALADDLDRWLAGERIAARPPSMQGRIVRTVRRHKHASIAVIVILLVLAGGLSLFAYLEWRGDEAEAARALEMASVQLLDETKARVKAIEARLEQAEVELRREQLGEAKDALDRAEERFVMIRQAFEATELPEARAEEILASVELEDRRRRYLLLRARVEAGQRSRPALERARESLLALMKTGPGELGPLRLLARVERDLGELDAARRSIAQVLAKEPGDREALILKAEIAKEQRRHEEVEDALTRVLDGAEAATLGLEERAALQLDRAIARLEMGRYAEARSDLEALKKDRPNDARVLMYLGEVARREAERQEGGARESARFEAARYFDRAVSLSDPEDYVALLYRGRYLLEQGYYLRAYEDLQGVVIEDDSLTEAYLWRGVAQYHLLQLEAGEKDLRRVTQAADKERALAAIAWRWLGRLLRASQARTHEAVLAYREALGLASDDAEALVGLGWSLLEVNRLKEAVEAFRAAGDTVEATLGLGECALQNGELALAVERFTQVIEAGGAGLVAARVGRARALRKLGRRDEAADDHRAALRARLRARDVRSFYREGRKHLALAASADTPLASFQRLERALAAFDACVRLVPTYARAHVGRAQVLARLDGKRPAALEACEAALDANPYALEAYLIRAQLRLLGASRADWEQAEGALGTALALGATDPRFGYELGRAYLKLDEPGRAVPVLEKVVADAPGMAEAFAALAQAYERTGAPAKAADARARFQALSRGARLEEVARLVEEGRRLRLKRDLTGSVSALTEAIALNPSSGSLYLERARTWLNALDQQRAVQDLARALERSPKSARHIYGLLRQMTSVFRWDEAFERARMLDGASEASRAFLLGLLYFLRVESGAAEPGDVLRGIDAFTEMLDDEPTTPTAYALRGLLLLRSNDLSAAREDLETALLLDKELSLAYVYLAGVYAQRRYDDQALTTLQQAIDSGFDDWAYLSRDPALAPLRTLKRWKDLVPDGR